MRPRPPTKMRRLWQRLSDASPAPHWVWHCPAELHGGRRGEVVGARFCVHDWPDAWTACLADACRHARDYHADGRRLGEDLALELREAEPDHDPDGPDAVVYHLEACS